jgi:hypothetical protein
VHGEARADRVDRLLRGLQPDVERGDERTVRSEAVADRRP